MGKLTLDEFIKKTQIKEFNTFIITLTQHLSMLELDYEVFIENIYKSPYINLELINRLYDSILNHPIPVNIHYYKTKFIPNILSYSIGNTIDECDINKLNISQPTINRYSSRFIVNKHISREFAKDNIKSNWLYEKFLSNRDYYDKINMNNIPEIKNLNTWDYYSMHKTYNKEHSNYDINDLINYYNELISKKKQNKVEIAKIKHHISINNHITWDYIINYYTKRKYFTSMFNFNKLCENTFKTDMNRIRNECILKWQAKCKIENWLYECIWNPRSTYRQKIVNAHYDSYVN